MGIQAEFERARLKLPEVDRTPVSVRDGQHDIYVTGARTPVGDGRPPHQPGRPVALWLRTIARTTTIDSDINPGVTQTGQVRSRLLVSDLNSEAWVAVG
jgi:hypothetical protein